METTLHTDVHGLFTDFSFQTKKLVTNPSVTQSVIIRVKRNLSLKHTTENHGDNSSHGCPRMSHGFLFSDKKLVSKSSVTHSVIIRVKLTLSLKDTTENHGDNASHGCPLMSHGFLFSDKKTRNNSIRDTLRDNPCET